MIVGTKARLLSGALALGGGIVLAVDLALVVGLRGSRSWTGAGGIGDIGGADGVAAGGRDAKRTRPLAALREGRLDEAFAWYARPDGGEPGAEELYTLGAALLAKDRPVLGWTALEAARRIDRGHAATGRALEELERTLSLAGGPDRVARREVANSRCFTGSRGAIHCATCHDPHRGLETSASRYEAKCLSCHASATTSPSGSAAGLACPVNPSSGCIDCHMPKVKDPGFQTRFTDHHIRVHRGNASDGRGTATDDRRR